MNILLFNPELIEAHQGVKLIRIISSLKRNWGGFLGLIIALRAHEKLLEDNWSAYSSLSPFGALQGLIKARLGSLELLKVSPGTTGSAYRSWHPLWLIKGSLKAN